MHLLTPTRTFDKARRIPYSGARPLRVVRIVAPRERLDGITSPRVRTQMRAAHSPPCRCCGVVPLLRLWGRGVRGEVAGPKSFHSFEPSNSKPPTAQSPPEFV